MDTVTYFQKTFSNISSVFHSIADDLTDIEWVARPAPGQNLVGTIVWHIPRTQDAHVQTWIRGIPQVVQGDRWAHWRSLKPYGYGAGIALAEADEIAHTVGRVDVMAYADAVLEEILAWLKGTSESDLDQQPDYLARLSAYPEYQTPGYFKEVEDLYKQPIWGQLMRPCIGHIHRHLGELESIKNRMRALR